MKLYGVAVVGCGIMGRRMIAALRSHARFRVVALWDPQASAQRLAAEGLDDAMCADSLRALVSLPAVDLVYVASPPSAHLDGVRAALDAHKACLCEKPLAHTVEAAQALRDSVIASGLPFAVNFPFARSEASRTLQALVRNGELGAVQQARITLRFAQWPRPWQAGAHEWLAGPDQGGFTREVLSHFMFLALRLFGPPVLQQVDLQREPGRAETRLVARLQQGPVPLTIDGVVEGDIADRNRFDIVGSRGEAALMDWSRLEHAGRLLVEGGNSTPATLDGVAAMLEGRQDHGLATADEALAVVRCIEAMLA